MQRMPTAGRCFSKIRSTLDQTLFGPWGPVRCPTLKVQSALSALATGLDQTLLGPWGPARCPTLNVQSALMALAIGLQVSAPLQHQ